MAVGKFFLAVFDTNTGTSISRCQILLARSDTSLGHAIVYLWLHLF